MAATVRLSDVVEQLQMQPDEWTIYLDKRTGKFLTRTDELEMGQEGDSDGLADWQREELAEFEEAEQAESLVALPGKFEIHEWSIVRRFCGTVEDDTLCADLLDVIHGRGAFRMFRSLVDRHGLYEAWFRFRQEAFEEIARDWLESHQIPYEP